MNRLTYAVGAFVVDQRRQDAAIGFAITCEFLEGNATITSAPVGDEKDEKLPHLSVHNVGIFVMSWVKTTIMKVARRIEIGVFCVVRTIVAIAICGQQARLSCCCRTWGGLVAERSPKSEVNIERSFDFDGDIAGNTDSHIIPERMMGCGRTT